MVNAGDATTRSLLELDPDLGQLLTGERRLSARYDLRVQVAGLNVGEWDVEPITAPSPLSFGLMIVKGVVARELALGKIVSSELLGPGDIVRPWELDSDTLQGSTVRWNVLAVVHLAILDARVSVRLARYPEVTAVLASRLNARASRLAMQQAIAQLNRVDERLEALLWHLAERWGRVGPDGVVLPLVLSHRALGELVGARRPTVSTALSSLARKDRVIRRGDGTWLLRTPAPSLNGCADRPVHQRRRLLRAEDLLPSATEPALPPADNQHLRTPSASTSADDSTSAAIEALYNRSRRHDQDLDDLRSQIAALRNRVRLAGANTARRPGTRAGSG